MDKTFVNCLVIGLSLSSFIHGVCCCPPCGGFTGNLPDPEGDCSMFYKCVNNIPTAYQCPLGQTFDPIRRICACPSLACILNPTGNNPFTSCASTCGCSSNDCSKYIPCNCGFPQDALTCPSGQAFNEISLQCEDKNSVCTSDGNFPDPTDCTQFTICLCGIGTPHGCPDGFYFNAKTGLCDTQENAMLAQVQCQPGAKLPYYTDCTKYIDCSCSCGNAKLVSCPSGQQFNAAAMKCDTPANARCTPITCGSPGEKIAYPADCSKYITCTACGLPILNCCPSGKFYKLADKDCTSTTDGSCRTGGGGLIGGLVDVLGRVL